LDKPNGFCEDGDVSDSSDIVFKSSDESDGPPNNDTVGDPTSKFLEYEDDKKKLPLVARSISKSKSQRLNNMPQHFGLLSDGSEPKPDLRRKTQILTESQVTKAQLDSQDSRLKRK